MGAYQMNRDVCEICGMRMTQGEKILFHLYERHEFDQDTGLYEWRCWCGGIFKHGTILGHLDSVDLLEHYAQYVLTR